MTVDAAQTGLPARAPLRPLLPVAGLFVIGIYANRLAPHAPGWYLIIAAVATALALTSFRRAGASVPAWCIAWLTLGVALSQLTASRYPDDHIAAYTSERPRFARIELKVVTPPRLLKSQGYRPLPPRQVARGEVTAVLTPDGWAPASGTILLSVSEPHATLRLGDTVRVTGMLHRPAGAANPGQFDWQTFYREQRIVAAVSVPHAANVTVLNSPGPDPLGRARMRVREWLERGFPPGDSTNHALLRALVLGDPDPELRDIQQEFVRTGTSHHLAISGMHVAIIGGLVCLLCRLFRARPRRAVTLAIGIVILYGLLVLPSPPVIRSILLCAAVGGSLLLRREADAVQLLAASVLAMLVYHPADVFSAGFQLSFVTVLGLMLFTRPVLEWVRSFRDIDFVIAEQVKPPPRIVRVWRFFAWHGVQALAAGAVAWLVAAPLVAYHFYQLNPWAIAGSILLALPVLLALVAGVVKIVLTPLLPAAASKLLAILAGTPIQWMRDLVSWLATLPGSDFVISRPHPAMLLGYYLLLVLPLWAAFRRRIGRWARATPCLCVAMLLIPLFRGKAPTPPPPDAARLTVLSVGAGQCVVLQLPSGKACLFDAGSSTLDDMADTCALPAMRHLGVTRIERVFVSHANADHYAAVAGILAHHPAAQLHLSPHFEVHAGQSAAGRSLREWRKQEITFTTLSAGSELSLDDQTTVRVLWPPLEMKLTPNDASLVLRVTHGGKSVLFTGDIQNVPLLALSSDPVALKSDVLIAPHHGSSEPATKRFLEAVSPSWIVSSSDSTYSQKQRRFDALVGHTPHYRTDRAGAVTVTISADGIQVTTFKPPQR
jgi:competence protein ComEC